MNNLIGDRKKSVLEEMAEVARERNKEVAEEERLEQIEAERRAKEEAERANMPSSNLVTPAGNIIKADYQEVKWDLHARKAPDGELAGYTYEKSLKRLNKTGKRHPLPSEIFSLIAAGLEKKLSGSMKAVADVMILGNGEWLSMAFERKGNMLICYLHPEGLVWDDMKRNYEQKDFKYYDRQEFDISGKKSKEETPLNEFEDDFVRFMYGRSFKDLPKEMRQGIIKADISLPQEGIVHPICRANYDGRFCIDSFKWYASASRGVCAGGSQ